MQTVLPPRKKMKSWRYLRISTHTESTSSLVTPSKKIRKSCWGRRPPFS
jgi:hypothetical protein